MLEKLDALTAVNSIVKAREQRDKTIEKVSYPQELVEYEFYDTVG